MENDFIWTICLKFPDVKEGIKFRRDFCFFIGKKMFCVTGVEGEFGVSFKVNNDEFEELSAPYGISPYTIFASH